MTSNAEPWSDWISHETIRSLYLDGINRYGGFASDPQPGCVEASLGAAYNAELYSKPEPEDEGTIGGLVFAGYLLFYLTTKHCYIDGNKRIAWLCAMFVLLRLGLTLQVTEDEAYGFCMEIGSGNINKGEEVVMWIADRLAEVT